jgi:aspartate racemase
VAHCDRSRQNNGASVAAKQLRRKPSNAGFYSSMTGESLIGGVLGGLGPEATVDFMARVIAKTPGHRDQDHVHLVVAQNPGVPDRQDALFNAGPDPATVLATMARRLENAGCDFLVMPCNTAHAYADSISAAVRIPLVSIIDVSVEALADSVGTTALLATPACIASKLYQDALVATGRDSVVPDEQELKQLMQLIYALKGGSRCDELVFAMNGLIRSLVSRGAEAIILACTELPLLADRIDSPVPLISSTEELAIRTVQLARQELPLPAAHA